MSLFDREDGVFDREHPLAEWFDAEQIDAASGNVTISIAAAHATSQAGSPTTSGTSLTSIAAAHAPTVHGTPAPTAGAKPSVAAAHATNVAGSPTITAGAKPSVAAAHASSTAGTPTPHASASPAIAATHDSTTHGTPAPSAGARTSVAATHATDAPGTPVVTTQSAQNATANVPGATDDVVPGVPAIHADAHAVVIAGIVTTTRGVPSVEIATVLELTLTQATRPHLHLEPSSRHLATEEANRAHLHIQNASRAELILMATTTGALFVGDVNSVRVNVTDPSLGTPSSFVPTSATLVVRSPSGASTTYSTGGGTVTIVGNVCSADVPCGAAGDWSYSWMVYGTGRQGAFHGGFTVQG